ncbi:hypothetical protein IPdc08_01049 [archaeon]|nr:hypothetical protein IPdc08_01049 [archaeon]
MYAFDTFILEVDIRKLKNATKIKSGKFDVEFLYKLGEGTVAGVICTVLVNLSNFSLVEVNFYSQHAKKVDIWENMVLNTIRTKAGKIKTVIADLGFLCYDIFWEIAGTMQIKLEFFENKSTKLAQVLIEDIRMIIAKTVENSLIYDKGFAKIISGIETLFKVVKRLFKQNNVHVYYTDKMHYKIYFMVKRDVSEQPIEIRMEGYEVVEKITKPCATSARVLVPKGWIGKKVRIVRLEP